MKPVLLLVSVLIAVSFTYSHAASIRVKRQVIPREFQNLNIENYLKNPRAVAFQLKCIIYDGPCDRIGKYLKVTIPELLTNQCKSCDPDQRKKAGQLVAFIQQNYPREWDDAVKKFQGNQQIKQEDLNKFEDLLGVKLQPTPAPDAAPARPVDLKNAANFLSQVGSQVSQNVKNGAAAPVGDGPIRNQAQFAASISDLIKDLRATTVKPAAAGEQQDKLTMIVSEVQQMADKTTPKTQVTPAPVAVAAAPVAVEIPEVSAAPAEIETTQPQA